MAGSLEGNKIIAAVLTAGIIASASGFLSRVFYSPEAISQNAFPIVVASSETEQDDEPAVEPIAVRLASATVAEGEKVAAKCSSCHSFDEGGGVKVGPNLYNIVGEPIGKGDYSFSSALADHGGDWTYTDLDGFLTDPRTWAPGTKMSFAGLANPEQRADVILYLHSLSPNPIPLPEVPSGNAEADPSSEASDDTDASDEAAEKETASASEQQVGAESTAATVETNEDQDPDVHAQANVATPEEVSVAGQGSGSDIPAAQPSETGEDNQAGEAAQDAEVDETSNQTAAVDAAGSGSSSTQSVEAGETQSSEEPTVAAAVPADQLKDPAPTASAGSDPFLALLASADPAAGQKAARKCMACHTFDKGGPNRVGPNLYGIVDSKIGDGENGYAFSTAMADHGGEWTYQNLDTYLTNPREWLPGTKMTFAGIKPEQERADVIAYLRTLSENPAPLP